MQNPVMQKHHHHHHYHKHRANHDFQHLLQKTPGKIV